MKIHICYEFQENHGGGGTSVLENLREFLSNNKIYTEDPKEADIILFNSFHSIKDIITLKKDYPQTLFIHRVDGPMGVYNSPLDLRDEYVILLNKFIADATIFQTQWSKKACHILGLESNNQHTSTIINAPNSTIFKPRERIYNPNEKLRIFYSSWSTNINKGFDTLAWLDENLDWKKYEFIFAGRTNYSFKNIKHVGSLTKKEIADQLYSCHVFLFASKFDPCSNSLAEAIATNIPILCYDGGGSPELLPKNSLTYQSGQEVVDLLHQMRIDYSSFTNNTTHNYTYQNMTALYLDFFKKCLQLNIRRKELSLFKEYQLAISIFSIKVFSKHPLLSRLFGLITGKYSKKVEVQHRNRGILND